MSLEEELDNLHKLDENTVQDNLPLESFVDLDSGVVTSASCMSDADILAKVVRPDTVEDEDDGDDNDDDFNDNIDDLDCPPPLTRPSKGILRKLWTSFKISHCSVPMRMRLGLLL